MRGGIHKLIESDEEFKVYNKARAAELVMLQSLPLDVKIEKSKQRIREAIDMYGVEYCYVAFSGGKDSTVLSYILRELMGYKDIVHIFSNTTNEYPETLKFVRQCKAQGWNIYTVTPKGWNFRKVVETHGYPLISKKVAGTIGRMLNAKTQKAHDNQMGYLLRNHHKYARFIDEKYKGYISDYCCDLMKKGPAKSLAKKLKMECAFIGVVAEESRTREKDWIDRGCNAFEAEFPASRPLSFWLEKDIWDFIKFYNVPMNELYAMGYERNGCMFCGFGCEQEFKRCGEYRFDKLARTHPKSYKYFMEHFPRYFDYCGLNYTNKQISIEQYMEGGNDEHSRS